MSAHEDLSRAHEIKGSSDRTFGITFAVFFLLLGVWPLVRHHPIRLWAVILAIAVLLISLVRPSLLSPLNWFWIRVGAVLNRVVSPVISGLVFFLAVTPTALIMRRGGKDPLRLRADDKADSYWIPRDPPGPEPGTMVNQF